MIKFLRLKYKLIVMFFVIFPIFFGLNSCVFTIYDDLETVNVKDRTLSVVFGYYDMDEASYGGIDWVGIMQYKPNEKYYRTEANDGFFYNIGIPNKSTVQVKEVWRDPSAISNKYITYSVGGKKSGQVTKYIKRPGVYFLGSYKYKNIDSGSIFKPDGFDMVKIKKPTEKELLKRVLKEIKSDYPEYVYQIKMIQTRLRKL